MEYWLGEGDSRWWDDSVSGVCSAQCMLHSVLTPDDDLEWWRGINELHVLKWWLSYGWEKESWGMKMRTMWRIREDQRNHGYNLPDWVHKTSSGCYYTSDRDSYLQYRGWSIDSHTKFFPVPVSHDDFPHLLWFLSLLCSTLPSPKITKWSLPSLSLHGIIIS